METEKKLAEYVATATYDDIPSGARNIIKNVVLTVLGTTIAGAREEGCEPLASLVKEWGGRAEATILIYGGKVPAGNAALVNSAMARALDFCDSMVPGMHAGSSSVPTALAAAELTGGCSGKDFLSAIALGTEVAARLNSISVYDGFDPTGVCAIFATAAIAGRMLHLDSPQMMNALALAFNRAGGSFQSNIDGSMAVSMIQGFVSQGGIHCAELAGRGITGPKNFIEGIYGYGHLYGRDKHEPGAVIKDLGQRFHIEKTFFKRYPSCGGTLAPIEAMLSLVQEKDLTPQDVARIDIKVTPYVYKLVGHDFAIGENPKISAQFNIQYCVADALLRKSSKLSHFDEACIREPQIMELARKIHVSSEAGLEDPKRPESVLAACMEVTTRNGSVHQKKVDFPRGLPGNPLTREEHMERFMDCVHYRAPAFLSPARIEEIVSLVGDLEGVKDMRTLISLLSGE